MKLLVLGLLCLSQVSFAQISSPPLPTQGSPVVPEVVKPQDSTFEKTVEKEKPLPTKDATLTSEENRALSKGTILVGLEPIASWIPLKKTLSYTHIFNNKWSLEGEYSWSSLSTGFGLIDFGEVKEKRYTLQARRYVGNSFHFTFGGVVSEFSASLGNDVLDRFGNNISSDFSSKNLGITGGMGNRWQWNNGFTLGIDWVRLNIPVAELSVNDNVLKSMGKEGDKSDVKKVIRTFNRIPTFVLLGVNLGYTF